jgi:hypothetical protein
MADNLPPSCADCLEIWQPRPPGTLRACYGTALPLQLKITEITKMRKCIKTVKNLPATFQTTSFQNMYMLTTTPSPCFTPVCFAHFCFNVPRQFTLCLEFHPLIWLAVHVDADWGVKGVKVNLVICYSDDMEHVPPVTSVHSCLQFLFSLCIGWKLILIIYFYINISNTIII